MTEEKMKETRFGFEGRWNRLNSIRTVTSTLTFIILIAAAQFT